MSKSLNDVFAQDGFDAFADRVNSVMVGFVNEYLKKMFPDKPYRFEFKFGSDIPGRNTVLLWDGETKIEKDDFPKDVEKHINIALKTFSYLTSCRF